VIEKLRARRSTSTRDEDRDEYVCVLRVYGDGGRAQACVRGRANDVCVSYGSTGTADANRARVCVTHCILPNGGEQASSQLKAGFPTHATTALCRTR
jgi:hypothetical protein